MFWHYLLSNALKQLVIKSPSVTCNDNLMLQHLLRWTTVKFCLVIINIEVGDLIYSKKLTLTSEAYIKLTNVSTARQILVFHKIRLVLGRITPWALFSTCNEAMKGRENALRAKLTLQQVRCPHLLLKANSSIFIFRTVCLKVFSKVQKETSSKLDWYNDIESLVPGLSKWCGVSWLTPVYRFGLYDLGVCMFEKSVNFIYKSVFSPLLKSFKKVKTVRSLCLL